MRAFRFVPLLLVGLIAVPSGARAEGETIFPSVSDTHRQYIRIVSTTDVEHFSPVIKRFQQEHPDLEVAYHEITSTPLYEQAVEDCLSNRSSADLVISSAVDLQLKLVNDGCAQSYVSDATQRLPSWASGAMSCSD